MLITGKGGVGRSSSTAALAQVAKARGLRVLIGEIGDDPKDYSPLARHFGRDRLPVAVEELTPGIRGVVLLARTGQEQFLKNTLHSATLARAALSSDALARLLSAGPSFREMGVFFQLLGYLQQERSKGVPEHEIILLDMPATGHTLSLTGLPELLLRLVPRGPIAQALRAGQSYLNDAEKAAAWVVTLPETLPVSAALEPILAANDVLGGESFRKPFLANRETKRLRAGTKLPIYEIPELPHATLIPSMASAIENGQPLPPQGSPSLRPPSLPS